MAEDGKVPAHAYVYFNDSSEPSFGLPAQACRHCNGKQSPTAVHLRDHAIDDHHVDLQSKGQKAAATVLGH